MNREKACFIMYNILWKDLKHRTLAVEFINKFLVIILNSRHLTIRMIKYQTIDDNIIQKILDHRFYTEPTKKKTILDFICKNQIIGNDIITKHYTIMSKDLLIKYQTLSEFILDTIIDETNCNEMLLNQAMPEKLIYKYMSLFDKQLLSINQPLTEEFIEKNKKNLHINLIGECCQYSSEFIMKNLNIHCAKCLFNEDKSYFDINRIIKYQNFSENMLDTIFNLLLNKKKNIINTDCKLQQEDLNKSIDKLVCDISWRQVVPDSIIRKYHELFKNNSLAVEELLLYQTVKEDTIIFMEYNNLISDAGWRHLSRNQKITSNIFKRFRNKIYKCKNSVKELKNYKKSKTVALCKDKLDYSIIDKIHSFL